LAPGVYTVHLWANDQGDSTATFEALGSATVTLTGCTSSTASPDITSPQTIGTTVTFTASSIGCPNPLYEFFLLDPAGTWHLEQPFGAGTTWAWHTAGFGAGTYTIHVWANQSGADMSTFEANGGPSFTLTVPPPCTSASLSPSSTSQAAGSSFTLTASSTGCSNPNYQFFVQYPDMSWNLKQGFGNGPAFNWNTSGLAPGVYTVHVWASATGAGYDAIGSSTVTLTGCTSASISPTNPSQAAGSIVALTGSAIGCPSPQFEYFVQYPSGTWYLKQGWGGAAFNWDTTGLAPGVYTVHAWANNQGASTASYETFGSDTVTLTGCVSAALSSATVGSNVTFTATATGCPNPVFEFFLLDTSGVWHMERGFSTTTTWTWNSTGWAKGTYTIHVWANQQGADLSTYETVGSTTYALS
jgi:cell wall-associated protease